MKAQTHLFLYPHHEFVHVGGGLDESVCFQRSICRHSQKIVTKFKAEQNKEKKKAFELNSSSHSQSFKNVPDFLSN